VGKKQSERVGDGGDSEALIRHLRDRDGKGKSGIRGLEVFMKPMTKPAAKAA